MARNIGDGMARVRVSPPVRLAPSLPHYSDAAWPSVLLRLSLAGTPSSWTGRTPQPGPSRAAAGKFLVALFTVLLGLITAATNLPAPASQDSKTPMPSPGCVNRDSAIGDLGCATALTGLGDSIGAQLVPMSVAAVVTPPRPARTEFSFLVSEGAVAVDPIAGAVAVVDSSNRRLEASSVLAPELAAGLGSTLDSLVTSMLHAFTVGINLFAVSPDHFLTAAGRTAGSVLASALGIQTNSVVLDAPGTALHGFADDRFELSSLSDEPPSRPD